MSSERPPDAGAKAEWGDEHLAALTAAILDGTPVDWAATESKLDARHVDTVQQLRVLAEMVAFHRSPPAQTPLATWGPLAILEPVGEGAFGEVFRAWDSRLEREVALKLLWAPDGSASGLAMKSIEEGRLIARVRHPNVVTVYGAERIAGRTGIWTEFIEGRTLKEVLAAGGPMSPEDVRAIGVDVCRALAAVHEAGLLHRDLKAQNVMRETGGRIVLMDFGTGLDLGAARAGVEGRSGTPLYLAPEIFAGGRATVASDIYALAVLLFHLLTGRYPVEGQTLDDVRAGHAAGRVLRLRDLGSDEALADVIERGLATDPSHRYESAAAFEAALSRIEAQVPVERHLPWIRPASLMMAAAVVLAGVTAVLATDVGGFRSRWFGGRGPNAAPVGAAASTTDHKLSPPETGWPGRHSRDGRFQPYIDVMAGNLWYWEIATGATHQVTKTANGVERGGWAAMSPDGSQTAYMWRTQEGAHELRVIASDGSTEPRVLLPGTVAGEPVPVEWSANGTQILCRLEKKDGTVDLSLVAVEGGAPKLLRTFDRGRPRHMSLSPDGQFVVYDFPRDFETLRSQLFILRTDGTPPRVLIDESSNDMSPFWTPDGTQVFYTSNRSGNLDGWVVDVLDGVASGEPVLVVQSLGLVQPVALTSDGAYHYRRDTSTVDVYSLLVDVTGGAPQGPGKSIRVAPVSAGGHSGPDWSPNGRFLAYITRVPSTATSLIDGAHRITILDTESGIPRDVVPRLLSTVISPPRWSPDGLSVVVKGTSLENRMGYFRVDTTTGETTSILHFGAADSDGVSANYRWSADGRALLYRHLPRGIVSHDVETGQETVVVDRRANGLMRFWGFAESPDGSWLAFGAGTSQGPTQAKALFVQADGGQPRELLRVTPPEWLVFQQWSSDSQNIFFTRFTEGEDAHALWRIPVGGGEAQDTHTRIPAFTQFYPIAVHRDGTRLAFTGGQTATEAWVMERFLPRPPLTRAASGPSRSPAPR